MPSRRCYRCGCPAISDSGRGYCGSRYTTGLDDDELDELTEQVERLRTEPWQKPTGRPRKLSLRKAVAVTCGDQRQNVIQGVLGEMFGVPQETVSQVISVVLPLIAQ